MSVEHDGYDGYDGGDRGQDGRADHAAPDPLLAVITDEPLPADADATARAEYRAATADVTALREQLRLIGTALSEPEPEPVAPPRPVVVRSRPRRRPLTLALRAAAVLCAATAVSGLAWLVTQTSPGGSDDSEAGAAVSDSRSGAKSGAGDESLSAAGYLACARLVVEGTVTEVEPVPGTGKDRVTLRVTDYLKPDDGPAETVFTMDEAVDPRLREGQHALVGIPRDAAEPDVWAVTEEDIARHRAWIADALPESRTIECG
ncbi:hypothetical protein [Streptomyces flavalbus]|uniref:Uncharacterized protein n=1 Tax=Streptomyces flavalbus TaxID=2665155 RepID=A0ABW2W9K3_9ACTN